MVLDRVTTASLFAILSNLYQEHAVYFLGFLGLDLASHWLQVVTTYAKGNESHKGDDESESAVVKIYYKSRIVLSSICACAEYFGCAFYVMAHSSTSWMLEPLIMQYLFYISIAGFAYKQFINIMQIKTSTLRLVHLDLEDKKDK
mmetsp:Transcript_17271/g.16916  ORF Transcript_17271/g.16916 Transcript_17271/m.16916 type:complete len:145 (-) Transcript_17271:14-448(-)